MLQAAAALAGVGTTAAGQQSNNLVGAGQAQGAAANATGAAIGNAIRFNTDYGTCMRASGWMQAGTAMAGAPAMPPGPVTGATPPQPGLGPAEAQPPAEPAPAKPEAAADAMEPGGLGKEAAQPVAAPAS
jgi:hypothetical protein